MIQTALFRISLTLILAWFLLVLKEVLPESIIPLGADGWFMSEIIRVDPSPFYYRSILTLWIHKVIYLIGKPYGLDGWYAIAVSSSLAGGIALQALWAIRSHPLFLAINILSGSFFIFVGHVENYGWVNAFQLLTYWRLKLWIEEDRPLYPAVIFLMLACFSHMMILFYIPAYVYLFWKKRDYHPYEILLPVVCFSLINTGLLLSVRFGGTDNGLERLVPFFEKWSKSHHFTFFTWEHLRIKLYFYHRAAFLLIPLEFPLLLILHRYINKLLYKFLLLCTLCAFIWTIFWHPDWGPADWDLFSQFGIPLHVLLGLVVTDYVESFRKNDTAPAQF
ncbi:MAG: hypothetical protein ACOX5R_15220 [bacterium]